MPEVFIAGRSIGPHQPPFIVAELSANHGGTLEGALAALEAAKAAGADAVKIQTYTADTLTIDDDGPDFHIQEGLWKGRRLYDLYQESHTPWAWHSHIFTKARELGIPVFSSPFDETAVALLESLDSPAYKIASFEMIDLALIRCVAKTGKPVIISTGMGTREEIGEAVETFRSAGGRELVLLHCVSGYPTPPEQCNIRRIPALAEEFDCLIGLSDHTLGIEVAVAAVALGACMIEKHFTIGRSLGGPDAAFSLQPDEFAALAYGARSAFTALGSGAPVRSEVERSSMVFRRSIYVIRDVAVGERFTSENTRVIRPGFGMAPKYLSEVIGRRARLALARGTRLTWDVID